MSITNNNKRKGRIPNSTNNRPKPTRARPKGLAERSVALDGVYNNARFMHSAASFVGCIVHVQVRNGNVYEGVFSTFSQDLDLVLDMVNLIEKNISFGDICMGNCGSNNNSILNSFKVEDCVAEKMIFKLCDVVATCAATIDLDYASKDGFTDGAISKNYTGNMLAERELEPWDGANEELQTTNSANSLDGEEESKGWDANEMFRTNAEKYNVKSTYDSTLQGYTIPLEPKNTDEYKKQEAKASKIAQEIENNPSYKARINMENGDEEERFSAVLRPGDNVSNSASRYVPHKKNIPGKMVRNPVPSFVHQNKPPNQQMGNMNSSITPTHSFNKNNCVPLPPNSLPIMPSTPLNVVNSKPPHMSGLQMTSPPQHQLPPNQAPPPRLIGGLQQPRTPLNHSGPPPPLHHVVSTDTLNKDINSEKHDGQQIQNLQDNKSNSADYRSFQDENLAPNLNQPSSGPGKNVDNRREDSNKISSGRDERGRDQQIAEFKKFSSDFKLTEDHRPTREEGGGRDGSGEECTPPPALTQQKDKTPGSEELTDNDCTTPDSDGNKIKKSVLNPNAKAFTPRAVPAATPPSAASVTATAVIPPRMHTQSPVVAVPQHQLVQGLGQPIFTPMGPQYVVSGTPVSMSLTTSFPPATMSSAHRFRKPGPMGVPTQQDFAPSVHVAAATGQPILTPGLPSPAQLAVQYNPAQSMMAPSPHQTAMAYPQMMYRYPMVGPRVVSPQQVGTYGEVFMAPHPGAVGLQGPHTVSVSAVQSMVPQGNQGPHSNPQTPQSQGPCTPMHTAPSPVHQQGNQTPHGTPSQTPTPSGGHVAPSTTPQSVVYHHHQMAQSMQGGLHTPPSTQAMQAIHASHINQSHPHAHHSFPTQQIVLMHQQAIPAHGPHGGPLSSGPHSLQGHAIHGQTSNHLGNPGGPHVLQHPGSISVIPTSSAMVHAPMGGPGNPFGPHPHQGRDRGRQHAGNR